MAHGKKTIKTALLAAAIIFMFPGTAHAALYRDVPETHFAYEAVEWVSNPANGSIMVGDAARNFNPTRTINKFNAAKTLAIAAGYKYTDASISSAERDLYERSYESFKTLLDSLGQQFNGWDKTADRQIAFLMYLEILTPADLSGFMVKSGNTEYIHNLSRQEAVGWLVKLVKKQEEADAITLPYHSPFRDDAQIGAEYKKSIYFAHEAGFLPASDGFFNPSRSISRAELAQMIFNMLSDGDSSSTPSQEDANTITGTVSETHLDTHVSITDRAGETTRLPYASNVVVTIDNTQRAPVFLTRGMTVTALLNSRGEITSLMAQTISTQTQEPRPDAPAPAVLMENEGRVVSSADRALTIETRRLRPNGEIIEDIIEYTLSNDAATQKDGATVPFDEIKEGDIVAFTYNGFTIHSITISETGHESEATRSQEHGVIEEIFIAKNSQRVTIRKADESLYSYAVNQSLYNAAELRVGMEVRLYLDNMEVYDIMIMAAASGATESISFIYGKVSALGSSSFTVVDASTNRAHTIHVTANTTNTRTGALFNTNQITTNAEVFIVFTAINNFTAKSVTIL